MDGSLVLWLLKNDERHRIKCAAWIDAIAIVVVALVRALDLALVRMDDDGKFVALLDHFIIQ